jgi:hypothetical protein
MQTVDINQVSTIEDGGLSAESPHPAHEPHSGALPDCATPRHTLCYHIFTSVVNSHPGLKSNGFPHQSPYKTGLKSLILKSLPGRFLTKKSGVFYGWVVLAVAFVTLVLGYAIRNSFSVFHPAIVDAFGWGRGDTALMFSITILVYGLVVPVAGSLVDRFGPELVLPIGACIVGGDDED